MSWNKMVKRASSVNAISTETGISQRNSNFGLVPCVHFLTNAVSSSPPRYGLNRNVDWASLVWSVNNTKFKNFLNFRTVEKAKGNSTKFIPKNISQFTSKGRRGESWWFTLWRNMAFRSHTNLDSSARLTAIYNSKSLSSLCSTGWFFARTFLRPLHVYGVFVACPFLVLSFVYLSAINTDVTLRVFMYYVLTRYSDLRDKRSKIKRLEKLSLPPPPRK